MKRRKPMRTAKLEGCGYAQAYLMVCRTREEQLDTVASLKEIESD